MSALHTSWQAISDFGQQMQQLADQEDWSGIAALAARRHQTVTSHFHCHPVCPDNAAFYKQHLSTFLQQEQQLKTVVEQARKKAIKGVISINQGRKAVHAYRNSAKP